MNFNNARWILYKNVYITYYDLLPDRYFREAEKSDVWYKAEGAGDVGISLSRIGVMAKKFQDNSLVIELEMCKTTNDKIFFKDRCMGE